MATISLSNFSSLSFSMDPNQNHFSNSQNFSPSQDYYPSLENIPTSEGFMQFEAAMNSQFSPNITETSIPEYNQTSENIPQSSRQKVRKTRTTTSVGPQGWTDQEDIALMSSWCIASENPIVGTNQKGDALWQRILDLYQQARETNPRLGEHRSAESLRNRYKRLNTNVTKWIGAYKEAYGRKRSGMSNQDVEREAQTIYGASKFSNLEVFEQVMRHHPKWELKLDSENIRKHPDDEDSIHEGGGSSKRSRTEEDGSDPIDSHPEAPISRASTINRPVGRDKAKAKRKGKATTSQSSVIPDDFTAELRAMRIAREKEIDVRREEVDVMNRKTDMIMLTTLMNQNHLSPQEEDLKMRLMMKLFSN